MATTADEVWQLLGELIQAQKETERLLQEQRQESERRFQESERLMREQRQESERLWQEQRQETERQLKEQSQRVDQPQGQLTSRFWEFLESQVRPVAIRLFQERGIEVNEISSDVYVETEEDWIQIDILVVNTTQAIAIEVKSKLGQDDVDEHLERLAKFKRLLPRYQPFQILGAVAAMVIPTDVARYAYRQGLFVIAQSGEDLKILNDAKFQPRIW